MVLLADNLDLQMRRKRLGLTQTDLAALMGFTGKQPHVVISNFETKNRPLPDGFTRADVERVLDTYERGMKAGAK